MITIDIDGMEAVERRLNQIRRRVGNLTPVLADMGEHATNSVHDNFESSTAPDGTPWAANSPTTMANYLGNGGGGRPLIDTHTLMNSIHYEVAGNTVTVGTNMVYAAMMHFGGTKAAYPHLWGDIPARPLLGLKEADKPILVTMAGDYLLG